MTSNFIHETATLGEHSHVWHFAVILGGVKIGNYCSIGSCTEIGKGSVIGNHTRIGFGCFFPSHSVIGNGVFVGPGVTCCDDRYPRVGNSSYQAEPPRIEDGASIGAGSVLLPGVTIGKGALVGAGSVITRNVPAGSVTHGEPARHRHFQTEKPVSEQ